MQNRCFAGREREEEVCSKRKKKKSEKVKREGEEEGKERRKKKKRKRRPGSATHSVHHFPSSTNLTSSASSCSLAANRSISTWIALTQRSLSARLLALKTTLRPVVPNLLTRSNFVLVREPFPKIHAEDDWLRPLPSGPPAAAAAPPPPPARSARRAARASELALSLTSSTKCEERNQDLLLACQMTKVVMASSSVLVQPSSR